MEVVTSDADKEFELFFEEFDEDRIIRASDLPVSAQQPAELPISACEKALWAMHDDIAKCTRPSARLVIAGAGTGKSRMAYSAIAQAVKNGQHVVVSCPSHKLLDEAEAELIKLTSKEQVFHFRGYEQPDPENTNNQMCRRVEDVQAVRRAGGSVGDVCGAIRQGTGEDERCEFNPARGGARCGTACAYQTQRRGKQKDIVMVPHSELTRDASPMYPATEMKGSYPPEMVVIDEDMVKNLIKSSFVSLEEDGAFAERYNFEEPEGKTDYVTALWDTLAHLKRVLGALDAGQHLAFADIEDLPSEKFTTFREMLYKAFVDIKNLNVSARHSEKTKRELARAHTHNRHITPLVQLFRALALAFEEKYATIPYIRGHRRTQSDTEIRGAQIHLRVPLPLWIANSSVVVLDATAEPIFVSQWLPELVVNDVGTAIPPANALFTIQVTGTSFSKGKNTTRFGITKPSQVDALATDAAKRAIEFGNTLAALAQVTTGTVGAVTYKGTEELIGLDATGPANYPDMKVMGRALCAAAAPDGVKIGHFNNIRGLNEMENVGIMVVAGRTLPAPPEVEHLTAVILGLDPTSIATSKDWYDTTHEHVETRDGTIAQVVRETHPNSDVELMRRSICESEVGQALDRGRGRRRTGENPLVQFVVGEEYIEDLAVDTILEFEDFDWFNRSLAGQMVQGGILTSSPLGISKLLAGRFSSPEAVRNRLYRNPTEKSELARVIERVERGGLPVGDKLFASLHPLVGAAPWRNVKVSHGNRNPQLVDYWVLDNMHSAEQIRSLLLREFDFDAVYDN